MSEDVDLVWKVQVRMPAHQARAVANAETLEEEFYKRWERPEVLPLIVGFAGLSPCRKHSGCSDLPGDEDDDVLIDGGDIGDAEGGGETPPQYAADGGEIG